MSTERLSWPTTRSVMILRTAYCQGLAIITQGPNPACHRFREVLLNTAKPPCLSITYGCHKRGETNHSACLRYLLSAFHRNSLPISARDQELTRDQRKQMLTKITVPPGGWKASCSSIWVVLTAYPPWTHFSDNQMFYTSSCCYNILERSQISIYK